MGEKSGFKMKFNKEGLFYIILLVIIFVFIIFMPNIYKFTVELKNGKLKTEPEVHEPTPEPTKPDPVVKDDLTGKEGLVCKKSESTINSNMDEKYSFYFKDDKLTGYKKEIVFDAITDESVNFLYSEQARYNNINNLYEKVSGFGYNSKLDAKTLTTEFIFNLEKLNPESLLNDDSDLSIELEVKVGAYRDEVAKQYYDRGYDCESK